MDNQTSSKHDYQEWQVLVAAIRQAPDDYMIRDDHLWQRIGEMRWTQVLACLSDAQMADLEFLYDD